jgi:hypothetical protein
LIARPPLSPTLERSDNPRKEPKMRRATIKPRYALSVVLAVFAIILSQQSEAGGTPNPPGTFSISGHGSYGYCVDPKTFAPEPCATKGTLVLSFSFAQAGVETRDSTGACISTAAVSSPLPPDAVPPNVISTNHLVIKPLDYDAATGTGDVSFTGYDGGKCVGAKFDRKGATEINSGTNHFVVSQNGNRIDAITTTNTNKENSFGSFLFYATELKQ